MSRPLRLEYPGAIWHVTSRGNERRDIYRSDEDRLDFLALLGSTVARSRWILHAWVLMRNHYHLLLETPEPTLSAGMKRLNEDHARRFNQRHGRVGHLFQGRFKGILVERETHLRNLLRYVVLNPVRCGAVGDPADYRWSNYRATAALEAPPPWLEVKWTLDQFDARDRTNAIARYREFVTAPSAAAYEPWSRLAGEIYLGSDAFLMRMQGLVSSKVRSRDIPRTQREFRRPGMTEILRAVSARFSISEEELLRRRSRSPARKAVAHLAQSEGDLPLRVIGEHLGVSDWAAAKLSRASAEMAGTDDGYRALLETIREDCLILLASTRDGGTKVTRS